MKHLLNICNINGAEVEPFCVMDLLARAIKVVINYETR